MQGKNVASAHEERGDALMATNETLGLCMVLLADQGKRIVGPPDFVAQLAGPESGGQPATDTLLADYRALLLPRLVEEQMLLLLRQGRITKWFSGIGQEAISVGCALGMRDEEWILTLHRNLGVFTTRNVPLWRLFRQFQGTEGGFTNGRDRSFHFGTQEHRIVGMISHLGPQLAVADGIALQGLLTGGDNAVLVFTGEGGTSQGDVHEAMNVAAVWDLPVLFVVENNGYGLSTPVVEQYRCESIIDRAVGYGMAGIRIDGNDLLQVKDTIRAAAQYARVRSRPVLIECMTFRMRGHEEASGVAYVPKALREAWAERDPIRLFTSRLATEWGVSQAALDAVRTSLVAHIAEEIERGFADIPIQSSVPNELAAVYPPIHITADPIAAPAGDRTLRFIDAIKEGLTIALEQDASLICMGQDIAEYGGAFKVTEGLVTRFGRDRIRNTPLCESAIIGAALGVSIGGGRSMVEMQFADFVSSGFTQIVNNVAKVHYRWGASARVVIRMPTGAGSGAGPFHSQSNEAWFTHTPGLYVAYPATPYDAKGLLLTALTEDAPVLFFEHKGLYRRESGVVPEECYRIPFGRARVVAKGDELTIITYGMGVHWASEWAARHPSHSVYLLDLRTLCPLDYSAIKAAVAHTGRVLVLHEDTYIGGIGADIAGWIGEHCFELLDAPVARVASLDTPVPFNAALESAFLAKSRLHDAIERLLRY